MCKGQDISSVKTLLRSDDTYDTATVLPMQQSCMKIAWHTLVKGIVLLQLEMILVHESKGNLQVVIQQTLCPEDNMAERARDRGLILNQL